MTDNFTKKYESFTHTTYSELGKEKKTLADWGIGKYKGRLIEFYNDPALIQDNFTNHIKKYITETSISKPTVIDFGSGDGLLIDTVSNQLEQEGYEINGVNLDMTEKSLKISKGKKPETPLLLADALKLPIKNSSVDIGLSRSVLNYLGTEKQKEYLDSIHQALKQNGIFIITWPGGHDQEKADDLTDFYAKITSIITGDDDVEKIKNNKRFSSIEEISAIAEKIGFTIQDSGDLGVEITYTPGGFSQRFKMSEDQIKKTEKIFQDWRNQFLSVDKKNYPSGFNYVILKK